MQKNCGRLFFLCKQTVKGLSKIGYIFELVYRLVDVLLYSFITEICGLTKCGKVDLTRYISISISISISIYIILLHTCLVVVVVTSFRVWKWEEQVVVERKSRRRRTRTRLVSKSRQGRH